MLFCLMIDSSNSKDQTTEKLAMVKRRLIAKANREVALTKSLRPTGRCSICAPQNSLAWHGEFFGHGKNMQACSPKSALWRMRSSSLNPEYKSFRHLPKLLNWVAGTALFLFSESIIKRMSPSAAQIQGHFNFFCKRTLGLVTPIIFMALQLSFLRL